MKVLLLGGTGAMGSYLSEILSKKGIDTYITSRHKRSNKDNITYIQGDAKDIEFIGNLLTNKWDAIVDFMIYDTATFKSRANLFLDSTNQYIYLSSSRVYAESKDKITEESPRLLDVCKDETYLSTDEYALSKARQENILQASKKKNWTIIRPYITYGKERLQLGNMEKEYWLYEALSGRAIIFNKEIAAKTTTLTNGYDVARAITALIGNTKACGEVFHITNPKSATWDKVLDIYLDTLEKHCGKRPKVRFTSLPKFMSCFPALYQIQYDRLYNREFDNSKIGQYIDINTFTDIEDGLKSTLTQFARNPKFKMINHFTIAKANIYAGVVNFYHYKTIFVWFLKRIGKKILRMK
ncbi:MAG: NAD-dependent epimerase/dehydratase family protein [Rikenellaceae bacterium]